MYDSYEFDNELAEKIKSFEDELAASWQQKKADMPLPQRAVKENWDDSKVRAACTHSTPRGGRYFMLSEYRQLIEEMDRVRRNKRG